MPSRCVRLEDRLLATAAMGLALAVTAPYREAEAADVCGAGTTTISSAQAVTDNCTLDAGQSVNITSAGSIPFTGANPAVDVANGAAAGSITNAGTVSVTAAGEEAIVIRTNGSLATGLTNSGTISSGSGSGINFISSGSIAANGITNASGADITADGFGIAISSGSTIAGGITNAGDITSTNDGGISLLGSGTTVAGGITNSSGANINVDSHGILVLSSSSVTGGISNAGTITAATDGIRVESGATVQGDVVNAAGALIDVESKGIRLIGTAVVNGSIRNAGTIESESDGLLLISTSTVNGSIINSGTITADVDGIQMDLSGTITGSVINSGTITAGDNGFEIEASTTITGSLTNSGTITAVDDGIFLSRSSIGGITNAAGATITGGGFAIQISDANAPVTVTNAGLLDGAVELDDGTLNLNGASARVDGDITGDGSSTVNVNGEFATEGSVSVGTLAVASSGVLTLADNVTATGFTNAGTVAIADGATRTVTGGYSQSGDGRLQIGATSDSSYGKISVSGAADFSASDALHVKVGSGASLAAGDQLLDVVQAGTLTASGVTVTDSSALLAFEGVVDGNTVDLDVASRSIEEIIESGDSGGNSGGAGEILDAIIAEGASGDMQNVIDALNALATDQEVEAAVQALLPPINGGHAQGNVAVAQAGASSVVLDRLTRITGVNAGGMPLADPVAWVKPFAADTAQGARGGVSGYDGITIGTAIGVDGRVTEDLRAGAALSYADATIDGRGASDSSIEIDSVQVTGYGTYDIDRKTHLNVLAGLGWNGNDSRRVIDFGGLDRTAKADYDSWHVTVDAELVRSYVLSDRLDLMPSLGVAYTYAEAEDFSETGAGAANLDVDDADADSLTLATSASLIYGLADGIDLRGNLGLTYDVLAGDDQVTSTFQGGGSAFVTESLDPAPFGVTAGAALDLVPAIGIDASLAYDIEAREDFRNHRVKLNLRIPF